MIFITIYIIIGIILSAVNMYVLIEDDEISAIMSKNDLDPENPYYRKYMTLAMSLIYVLAWPIEILAIVFGWLSEKNKD